MIFLGLPKDKFKELTDYVYQEPHDHLMMVELNRNKLYRNFNPISQT
eukprot:SAG31_NODE_1972_length_6762_cov_16.244635_2_plen_47_part_00